MATYGFRQSRPKLRRSASYKPPVQSYQRRSTQTPSLPGPQYGGQQMADQMYPQSYQGGNPLPTITPAMTGGNAPTVASGPGVLSAHPSNPQLPGGGGANQDYISQANAQVKSMLDPMLKYITGKYGAQASAFSGLAGSVTDQYASALGQAAGNTKAMYEEAQGPVSRVAQGINQQMTAIGQENAAREQASQAQAGQASAMSPDINLAQEGAGAGGAAGAIGQAMISALQEEQAAAMKYAEGLPGFAQLEGQYQTKEGLLQIASTMADQLAQTTAQAPQLFYQIYNNLLDRADKDKSFAEQVRQFNVEQKRLQTAQDEQTRQQRAAEARQKAGIAGRNAPTTAGREAYWQTIADRRTKYDPHGYVYEGTSSGIRPVKDPKTGRPIVDPAYTAAQGKSAIDAAKVVGKAKTDAEKIALATKKANDDHQEALARINTANRNATSTEERNQIARQRAAETDRYHKALIAAKAKGKTAAADKPLGAPTGNQPRRSKSGVWTTATGTKLTPAGQKHWEHQYQVGRADGRGGYGKKHPKYKGGSTSSGGSTGYSPKAS